MRNKETISVVIPTYNRASTLSAAIQSVLMQTYPALEILVCDDGSTDNSRDLIYKMNDPKIVWIDCGRNGGPAVPRNKGIRASKGDWVAFLDSDDLWLPEKLERQMSALAGHGAKASCANAMRVKNNTVSGPYFTGGKEVLGFRDLLPVNPVICSSVLVNKQVLLATPLFPGSKEFIAIEDYALWLKISCLTPFVFSKEPLLNYTDDPGQSIRKEDKSEKQQRQIIFAELETWLAGSTLPEKKELLRLVKAEQEKLEKGSGPAQLSGLKRLIKSFLRR